MADVLSLLRQESAGGDVLLGIDTENNHRSEVCLLQLAVYSAAKKEVFLIDVAKLRKTLERGNG